MKVCNNYNSSLQVRLVFGIPSHLVYISTTPYQHHISILKSLRC